MTLIPVTTFEFALLALTCAAAGFALGLATCLWLLRLWVRDLTLDLRVRHGLTVRTRLDVHHVRSEEPPLPGDEWKHGD